MKRILITIVLAGALVGVLAGLVPRRSLGPTPLAQLKARMAVRPKPGTDHGKLERLKGPFARPQDVTAACISCHNGRHLEVMKSSHWNWERTEYVPGRGLRSLGKKNILNNFCIGIGGNEQSCNKCHAGYGWGDASFDFTNPLNIDCLACHDRTGAYVKASGGAGMPDKAVDLAAVARGVGRPNRTNCGTCHFFGGGGNNVKHGDLDKALFDPTRALDVHMASQGPDMTCVDCHQATNHQMKGKLYSVSSMNRHRSECEDCHGNLPHQDPVLDRHTLKVACQTCHIPTYAKGNPTKLTWDWSTAGQLKDGQPFEVKNPDGTDAYLSIKGSFTWGRNVRPEYRWSNGTARHYLLGDPVEAGRTVKINELLGGYDDPEAKIIPVKVHRARQIWDPVNRTLIQPKTVSTRPGDGGYWAEFDWAKASAAGMKEVGLPWSGQYAFIDTEMTWPVNHMVAPKAQALACTECHARKGGRLEGLRDFYLPGRDTSPWIEALGRTLLGLALAGVLLHAIARGVVRASRKEA